MREIPAEVQDTTFARRLAVSLGALGRSLVAFGSFCRRKPLGGVSAIIIIILVIAAVFADLISPNDPLRIFIGSAFAGPGHHPAGGGVMVLGADAPGRDLFARLVFGARISLLVGVGSVLVGGVVGIALGLASAYYGGTLDLIVQRFIDGVMAFPALVLALVVVTLLGTGFSISGAQFNVIISIAIVFIPLMARVVRGAALSTKENVYVDAARAIGAGDFQIMFRHILPNITHAIVILGATYLGGAILLESSLSFLGQGTVASQPSWGNMIAGSRANFETHQRLLWAPAVTISLAVLAFNLLGDALRDVWDPRLRNT